MPEAVDPTGKPKYSLWDVSENIVIDFRSCHFVARFLVVEVNGRGYRVAWFASKPAPTGPVDLLPDRRHQKAIATKYYMRHIMIVIKSRSRQVFLHDQHAQP